MVRILLRILPLFVIALLLNSCLYAGMNRNLTEPCTLKLRVATYRPETVSVRVESDAAEAHAFDSAGYLDLEVPPIRPDGCTTGFGFVLVRDGRAEKRKAVRLLRNDRVIRRFSLEEIEGMPMDDDGYRTVEIHPTGMGGHR